MIDFHGLRQASILLNKQELHVIFLHHTATVSVTLHNIDNRFLQHASILTLLPASCSLRSDSSEGSSLGERGRGRWESEAKSPREMSVHM